MQTQQFNNAKQFDSIIAGNVVGKLGKSFNLNLFRFVHHADKLEVLGHLQHFTGEDDSVSNIRISPDFMKEKHERMALKDRHTTYENVVHCNSGRKYLVGFSHK